MTIIIIQKFESIYTFDSNNSFEIIKSNCQTSGIYLVFNTSDLYNLSLIYIESEINSATIETSEIPIPPISLPNIESEINSTAIGPIGNFYATSSNSPNNIGIILAIVLGGTGIIIWIIIIIIIYIKRKNKKKAKIRKY